MRGQFPKRVLQELKSCKGVIYTRNPRDIDEVDLTNSQSGKEVFEAFLQEGNIDALVFVTFGHPAAPYLNWVGQMEVYCVLASYQPLLKNQLVAGGFPFVHVNQPPPNYHYHNAQAALFSAMQELATSVTFGAQCPVLSQILGGQIVCDLSIVYANLNVHFRVLKKV